MLILDTSTRRVGVFIDVQNMYYSARNIYGSKVNFGAIVKAVVGNQKLIRAIAYTISTKTGDEKPFFDALEAMGIEVAQKELLEYDSGHKKGDWDVGITIDDVRMLDMLDTVVMVSGDGDYCALADYVKNRGRIFHVASFRESTSSKLVECADIYTNLSQDKKAFLIGSQDRRPVTHKTSSQMDTFDDVIAEQFANKAIDVSEGGKWTAPKAPPIPTKRPIVIPEIPVFKHSFKKQAEPPNSQPKRRGRPRKDPAQQGG
jgi:uncharacterized LabA/DUF88 family protein